MERIYRCSMKADDLIYFKVAVKETDLMIGADSDLTDICTETIRLLRADLERYIIRHPEFQRALAPVSLYREAPEIARRMAMAAKIANVGPMAAVAGAFSQMLAERMDALSENLLIENGGDLYIKTDKPRHVAIYAGENKFKDRIKVRIKPEESPLGICTSSGKLGHSLSFGLADAVTIFSKDAFLADAAATSVCNRVRSASDIESALHYAISMEGISGVLIIAEEKLGVIGNIELI
ncbi:MAG: UPF0280 family protein [Anaerofustis sp.]